MAIGNYQLPNKIRFYISYPLWVKDRNVYSNLIDDSFFNLDPSFITKFPSDQINYQESSSGEKVQMDFELTHRLHATDPSYAKEFSQDGLSYTASDLHINYAMLLGHNLASDKLTFKVQHKEGYEDTPYYHDFNNIDKNLNYQDMGEMFYNGWSLATFEDTNVGGGYHDLQAFDFGYEKNMVFKFTSTNEVPIENLEKIHFGSFVFGRYFDLPINLDAEMELSYDIGAKRFQTKGGKDITAFDYERPSSWMLPAWQMNRPNVSSPSNEFYEINRSGRRVWSVKLTMLQEQYAMNQNNMINDVHWTAHDGYSGSNNNSTYNALNGQDFYSRVLSPTKMGNLPFCIQLSTDNDNLDQFAIVKMSDFSMTQTNPRLVDIQMTLTEQI